MAVVVEMAGLIRLNEIYMERVWGGSKLKSLLGKPVPQGPPVGEAWIVSDHATAVSSVVSGPLKGYSLHELLTNDPKSLLGYHAKPTPFGRFPLLLKLLDTAEWLSIQVHPDDQTAVRLGELDVGKTEMWYIMNADPGSRILCGMNPTLTAQSLPTECANGAIQSQLKSVPVTAGDAVFVPAGHMHSIGGGVLLAEIQQNSDLTYRVYDWGREGDDGKPRPLHIDKALEATRFGAEHPGLAIPLALRFDHGQRAILGACRYFATEKVDVSGTYVRDTRNASFHILLGLSRELTVTAGGDDALLRRGEALLIPGCMAEFRANGTGSFLDYYVPDLLVDVVEPLRRMGYRDSLMVGLGGDPVHSDVALL
ncbi:MAG: mannose-6-phosphate isomerase [Candidatus Hydrogenedentota bacterium]